MTLHCPGLVQLAVCVSASMKSVAMVRSHKEWRWKKQYYISSLTPTYNGWRSSFAAIGRWRADCAGVWT
jgi:hypothetical protein